MTFQSFKDRVLMETALLAIFGKPTGLTEVIYNVPEWHYKWLEAMAGRCDT